LAVWGFRLAVLSLAVLVASLVALVTTGDGAWVLFGALCGIVAGDIGIFTGYAFVKRDRSKPLHSFMTFRRTLMKDALHGAPPPRRQNVPHEVR
jgi:hypothetical protein